MRATFQAARGLLSTDGIYPCLARRLFAKATRCGHSVCNACFSVLSPVYKLTNFRLSSENNSPDCFLSSSPLQFKTTLMVVFFYASDVSSGARLAFNGRDLSLSEGENSLLLRMIRFMYDEAIKSPEFFGANDCLRGLLKHNAYAAGNFAHCVIKVR